MSDEPFERVELVDGPLVVGARWWQESMALIDPIARRKALIGVGAVLATTTLVLVGVKACSSDDIDVTSQEALAAQRSFGWSFGSEAEALSFDNAASGELAPGLLERLATELAPKSEALRPYYVPTLFQAATATPTSPSPATANASALRSVIKPILTPAMEIAFLRGQALASLFDGAPAGKAVVVDLPGPESIAFAAGLAERFDPVFTFDNWPHPRGVVPAHLTLAAAAHFAPAFARARALRDAAALPVFVLDENRLAPYADASDRFDNRYLAKLPTAAGLKALGVREIVYVRRTSGQTELDDLNADFVAFAKADIPVRMVPADAFQPSSPSSEGDDWAVSDAGAAISSLVSSPTSSTAHSPQARYYYGTPHTHWFFWSMYGWGRPPRPAVGPPPMLPNHPPYVPTPRSTLFAQPGTPRSRPSSFGSVGVARARGTGQILGPTLHDSHWSSGSSGGSRSGSWGRSGGSSGGSFGGGG